MPCVREKSRQTRDGTATRHAKTKETTCEINAFGLLGKKFEWPGEGKNLGDTMEVPVAEEVVEEIVVVPEAVVVRALVRIVLEAAMCWIFSDQITETIDFFSVFSRFYDTYL
jgi:hypothetical protein